MKEGGQKIIIILNKGKNNQQTVQLDQRLIHFGLYPLQSEDYSQPFQIPEQIANSQVPFNFIQRFASVHSYSINSPKVKLPINTTNYKEVVDKLTYQLCQRYTNLDYAQEVEEILKLAKWLQFRQVQVALAAAVGVNYYTGCDEKQVQEFIKKNKLDELTPEQVERIYEENKDLFNYMEQKTKEEFIKQSENNYGNLSKQN